MHDAILEKRIPFPNIFPKVPHTMANFDIREITCISSESIDPQPQLEPSPDGTTSNDNSSSSGDTPLAILYNQHLRKHKPKATFFNYTRKFRKEKDEIASDNGEPCDVELSIQTEENSLDDFIVSDKRVKTHPEESEETFPEETETATSTITRMEMKRMWAENSSQSNSSYSQNSSQF